jgi:hypothetical protein
MVFQFNVNAFVEVHCTVIICKSMHHLTWLFDTRQLVLTVFDLFQFPSDLDLRKASSQDLPSLPWAIYQYST